MPAALALGSDAEGSDLQASGGRVHVDAVGLPGGIRPAGGGSNADQARAQGASVLLAWAVRGDESLAGFLQGAGLTRMGSFRELPVGQGVTEDCWAAML